MWILAVFLLGCSQFLLADDLPTGPSGQVNVDPNSFSGNSKSNSSVSTNTGGFDRIEKVTKTEGGVYKDGKLISSQGSEKDKGFVEGFLNGVSNKVTGVTGSAWATSWSAKYKMVNGKWVLEEETFHKGSIKLGGENDPKPTSSSGPTGPSSGPSASSVPSSSSPSSGSPSTPSGSSATGPKVAGTPSSSPGKSAGPTGTTPSGTTTTGPATPPPTGFNPAPPKIPDTLPAKVLTLVLEDQKTNKEQPFTSIENGIQTVSKPIPEDVRTRFMLELGPGLKPEDISVTLVDDSGAIEFPEGKFPMPYHHIFRIPSDDRYFAKVFHTDPTTNKKEEKLHVTIPVYKMDVFNKIIDTHQNRTPNTSAHYSSSSSGNTGQGSFSSGSSSEPYRTGERMANVSSLPMTSSGSDENDPTTDVSDIYRDPSDDGSVDIGTGMPGKTRSGSGSDSESAGKSGDSGSNEDKATTGTEGETGSPDGTEAVAGDPSANGIEGDVENDPNAAQYQGSAADKLKQRLAMIRKRSSGRSGQSRQGGASASGGSQGGETAFSQDSGGTPGMVARSRGNHSYDGTTPAGSSENGSAAPAEEGVKTGEVVTLDKDFTVGLTMYTDGGKLSQSFDFTHGAYQTSRFINKNTKLNFSIDLGQKVSRDSVRVIVYDGAGKREMNLMDLPSDLLAHQFEKETQEAYIWIYGNTEDKPFSYKVQIPVVGS
jgi:hypothetical protein